MRIAFATSMPDRRGIGRHPGRLAYRRGHLHLPQFLEAAAPELIRFGVPGQQHHRRFLSLAP